MKSFLTLIFAFALCAIFSAPPRAQTATKARQELEAIYAVQDRATAARDFKTIAAHYAAHYAAETKRGKLTRDESLKNLQSFFETIKEISFAKTTIERVEQIRGIQFVFLTRQIKGTMIFAAGKTREFELTIRAEEQWAKTDEDEWLMQAAVERNQTLKIEGIEENNNVLESNRTELETIYRQIDAALKAQNPKAMFVYWAADFIEINNGKESSSADVETAVNSLFAQITAVENVIHKINSIKTVDGKYVLEITRTIAGEMMSKGKIVPFQYGYKAKESWVKDQQEAWKLETSEIIADSFLINGKKIQ